MERVDKALNWIGKNKRNLAATGVLLPSALFGIKCAGGGDNSYNFAPENDSSSKSLIGDTPTVTIHTPSASAEVLRIGDAAPDFQLKSIDGKIVKLSDFKGRPVVVVTWADFAANISNTAANKVLDAASKAGNGEMVVLMVSNTDNKSVRQFSAGATVLVDSEAVVTSTYHSSSVPEVLEISKDGKLVARRSDLASVDLQADFAALVGGKLVSLSPGTAPTTAPVPEVSECVQSPDSQFTDVSRPFGTALLQRINGFRAESGATPLKTSSTLQCLAEQKAHQTYGKVDVNHLDFEDKTAADMAKKLGYTGELKAFSVSWVTSGRFPTDSEIMDRIGKSLFAPLALSKDKPWVGIGCTRGFAFDKSQGATICFVVVGTAR